MDLRFLFKREGITPASIAEAANVDHTTAWRWKRGEAKPRWEHVCRLYARGLITDDDLRAGGLAIPRASDIADAKVA